MIKTTVNITIDDIKNSMEYVIIDVTVQTWAGLSDSKMVVKETLVVLWDDLARHIDDGGDKEPLFLFIVGEVFQRSMFKIEYGAEVIEIRDMHGHSNKYLLYYEPGSQPVMNVKFMRLPDRWYEQQAILLRGIVLETKAEGLPLFPIEKVDIKDVVDYEEHAKRKFRINTRYNKAILEKRKEGTSNSEVTIRKPICQDEWDSKLHLGWSEHDLEKAFYVSESATYYTEDFEECKNKKEEDTDGEEQIKIRGYI